MIALDTNILVHARRKEMPHHRAAQRLLDDLSEGDLDWAVPWPCVYEFVRVVTHPSVFTPPTALERVVADLERLFECPTLTLLGNGPTHVDRFRRMLEDGDARGNLAHDAHIAALCVEHGVRELLTLDRDLSRFPGLRIRNPFRAKR